jgi:hypothetical protein
MHQTSSPYRVEAGRNRHFGADTFSTNCDTLFWSIESCIMLSPIQMRPRFGA